MADMSVRIKIDKATQITAANMLEDLGITPAEVYRTLMRRIVKERKIPFDVKVPNAETREAMRELEEGRGVRCRTIEELRESLDADD